MDNSQLVCGMLLITKKITTSNETTAENPLRRLLAGKQMSHLP
jgi:hypothetical protein